MTRRIRSATRKQSPSLPDTNIRNLRRILRVGEILPGKIIEDLGNGHFIVEVKHQQVHAESSFKFSRRRVYVQVKELAPRVHLKLVSAEQKDHTGNLIRFAEAHDLSLGAFNHYVLSALLTGSKVKKPDQVLRSLEGFRALASMKNVDDLVSLKRMIDLFAGEGSAGNDLDVLVKMYQLRNRPVAPLPSPEEMQAKRFPAVIRIDGLDTHWKRWIRLFPETRQSCWLEEFDHLLGHLNPHLFPDKIQLLLSPVKGCLLLTLWESRLQEEGPYHMQTTYDTKHLGRLKLRLSLLDLELSCKYAFPSEIALRLFAERESKAREIVQSEGFEPLHFKYVVQTVPEVRSDLLDFFI